MKSRARCVPLQYLSSATRGVKQALNYNKKLSNQNLFVVSTLLQEQKSEKNSILLSTQHQSSEQVSSTESKMYYELGNKRRMECELYQDCSWFQQDTMKGKLNSSLSLVETPEPTFDPDEFDLAMQFANAQTIPWGDEYLEVFENDILQDPEKLGDKSKTPIVNFKGDDNLYDTTNVNFSLRKTDSFDSMKNISYTNPAEVIPISYKEKLNNSSYGSGILDNKENNVKEEVDLNSPESNSYVMDSDDNELNIGREEIIEELNPGNYAHETTERDKISPDFDSTDLPLSAVLPIITPIKSTKKIQEKYPLMPQKVTENVKETPIKVKNCGNIKSENEKLPLSIDIGKVNIEQSINVNTPDLDFMDLVEYINEEMCSSEVKQPDRQSQNNSSTDSVKFQSEENQGKPIKVESINQSKNESSSPNNGSESAVNTSCDDTIVDFNQVADASVSIAERIKTSAKRRTHRKYSVKDIQMSEDEEDSFDEDDDEDEDYDFVEDVTSRKSVSLRKRSKSSASESSSSGKKFKEDSGYGDSYRERRDKNNEASRRSRQNRKDRERAMYKTLEEEERRNVRLKAESDILEKQVTSLRQLLLQVVLKKGSVT